MDCRGPSLLNSTLSFDDQVIISTTILFLTTGGHVVQAVKCLTADPGVASLIPVRSHTFVEIDHEIISMAILLLPLVVSYKRKYVHEVLVNCLIKKCG